MDGGYEEDCSEGEEMEGFEEEAESESECRFADVMGSCNTGIRTLDFLGVDEDEDEDDEDGDDVLGVPALVAPAAVLPVAVAVLAAGVVEVVDLSFPLEAEEDPDFFFFPVCNLTSAVRSNSSKVVCNEGKKAHIIVLKLSNSAGLISPRLVKSTNSRINVAT